MSGHKRRRSPDVVGHPRVISIAKQVADEKRRKGFKNNMGTYFSPAHKELWNIHQKVHEIADFLKSIHTRRLLAAPHEGLIPTIEDAYRVERHILQRIVPYLHRENPDIPQDQLDPLGFPCYDSDSEYDREQHYVVPPPYSPAFAPRQG